MCIRFRFFRLAWGFSVFFGLASSVLFSLVISLFVVLFCLRGFDIWWLFLFLLYFGGFGDFSLCLLGAWGLGLWGFGVLFGVGFLVWFLVWLCFCLWLLLFAVGFSLWVPFMLGWGVLWFGDVFAYVLLFGLDVCFVVCFFGFGSVLFVVFGLSVLVWVLIWSVCFGFGWFGWVCVVTLFGFFFFRCCFLIGC